MQIKSLILASFFYARHQGKGGNDSVDNFFVYAKKLEEKQPDKFGFKSALGSSFMCTSDTLLQLIQTDEQILKRIVNDLYESTKNI